MTDMSQPQEENPGDEASEYRRILLNEVRNHRLFARFTVITSLGLIGVGVAIAKLQKELRRIEKTFKVAKRCGTLPFEEYHGRR